CRFPPSAARRRGRPRGRRTAGHACGPWWTTSSGWSPGVRRTRRGWTWGGCGGSSGSSRSDPFALVAPDLIHSVGEERGWLIRAGDRGVLVVLRGGEQDGRWPSLVFSPMLVEDGRRLLISYARCGAEPRSLDRGAPGPRPRVHIRVPPGGRRAGRTRSPPHPHGGTTVRVLPLREPRSRAADPAAPAGRLRWCLRPLRPGPRVRLAARVPARAVVRAPRVTRAPHPDPRQRLRAERQPRSRGPGSRANRRGRR